MNGPGCFGMLVRPLCMNADLQDAALAAQAVPFQKVHFLKCLKTQNGRSVSTPWGLRILPSNSWDKASPINCWLISEHQPARVGVFYRDSSGHDRPLAATKTYLRFEKHVKRFRQ